ncbi:hypothetical protein NDU88_001239 [Pleurodeles waltl]|uniref:Uncharacterized protein n=1 Tax=Pleurodeles waltl TaxID=8319 RepID=A0AAV7NC12_PLEWA|nr:hypothetical protein NDU88_001239 [Pleurodeles waltl]
MFCHSQSLCDNQEEGVHETRLGRLLRPLHAPATPAGVMLRSRQWRKPVPSSPPWFHRGSQSVEGPCHIMEHAVDEAHSGDRDRGGICGRTHMMEQGEQRPDGPRPVLHCRAQPETPGE